MQAWKSKLEQELLLRSAAEEMVDRELAKPGNEGLDLDHIKTFFRHRDMDGKEDIYTSGVLKETSIGGKNIEFNITDEKGMEKSLTIKDFMESSNQWGENKWDFSAITKEVLAPKLTPTTKAFDAYRDRLNEYNLGEAAGKKRVEDTGLKKIEEDLKTIEADAKNELDSQNMLILRKALDSYRADIRIAKNRPVTKPFFATKTATKQLQTGDRVVMDLVSGAIQRIP